AARRDARDRRPRSAASCGGSFEIKLRTGAKLLRVRALERQADSRAGKIGPQLALVRAGRPVEEHLLDAHMVEEPPQVANGWQRAAEREVHRRRRRPR